MCTQLSVILPGMLIVCPDSGAIGSLIFKIRKTLSQLKHWPPALLLPLLAPSSGYWLSSRSRKDCPGWPTSDEGQLLFGISRIFSFVTNSLIRSTNSGWRSECWKPKKTDQKRCSVASESSPYAESGFALLTVISEALSWPSLVYWNAPESSWRESGEQSGKQRTASRGSGPPRQTLPGEESC